MLDEPVRDDAPIVILPARGAHLQAAFALRRRVFIEEQRVPEEEEYDARDETATHVAVMSGDLAVGTGRVSVEGDLAHIQRIAVDARWRRRGVGCLVMGALEETARQRGATRARVAGQLQATPFYASLGYVAWGDVFLDAAIEHRWMDKVLGR